MTQQDLAKRIDVSWEMVSRYERGISSPMGRIDAIATALNVEISELLQKNYNPNSLSEDTGIKIPLFTKIPPNNDFKAEITQYFYMSPEWILRTDRDSFAIDPNIIEIKTVQISNNGPIYISPSSKPSIDDFVLILIKGTLSIDLFDKKNIYDKIIGVVLAQENRFKS
jgi:transcriptional regulator with XRE-family HTH domain